MQSRYGVVMVLFDLPVATTADRRTYHQFMKTLKRNGYMYFHDSVYVKLLRNISSTQAEIEKLKREAPEKGSVRALPMNMSAFRAMVIVQGEPFNINLFSDDVIVVEDSIED